VLDAVVVFGNTGEVGVRGATTVSRPAEGNGDRERRGQDQKGQNHVHGSNYSDQHIPPTVAELTYRDKMLPC